MYATVSACWCWDVRRRILFSMLSFYWLSYLNGPHPLLSVYLTVITPWDNMCLILHEKRKKGMLPCFVVPRGVLCAQNILSELDHNLVIRRKSESQNTWQSSASERQGSGFQIHILEFVVEMACPPWLLKIAHSQSLRWFARMAAHAHCC